MSILKAHNITKSYTDTQKRVDVLKGVSLEIAAGESVAIIGPSGAGKSTLLHVLGGLDRPDSGQVLLSGENIYSMSDAARARMRNRDIGFVFQFYHLLPELTAFENVLFPMMVMSGNLHALKTSRERARVALEQVGLAGRLDHKPNQLSGGEQQRVAIARAMINEPRILLCDEPTGNLDSKTGEAIIETLMRLHQGAKRTLVIVTHDEGIARRCQRTVYIRDGVLHQP